MPLLLRHVPTNAVAYLALFVALGGTSYAAVKLPRNSVGTKQIRAKAVTLAKIAPKAPRSLRGATGPAGAAGPARPAGTAGAAGAPGDPGPLGPPGPTASGFARQADGQKHAPIGFDARTTFVETGAEAGPHRSGPIQVAVPSTLLRVPAIRRGVHAAGDQPQVLRGRPRVDPRLSGPVARGGGARRAGQIRRAGPLLNLTAIVAGR